MKITIAKNSDTSQSAEITIKLRIPFSEFCDKVAHRLNYDNPKALRFFKNSGIELFEEDIGFIKNGDTIIVSKG